jgi:hypothetical protein
MVKDKIGDRFPVIFSTRNPVRDVQPYKTGRLLCLANGSMLDFHQKLGYFVKYKSTTLVRRRFDFPPAGII